MGQTAEVVLRIFIAFKNPSSSSGFKPANYGFSGKHDNHHTTLEGKLTVAQQKKKGPLTSSQQPVTGPLLSHLNPFHITTPHYL
jgi:hypothetical protein